MIKRSLPYQWSFLVIISIFLHACIGEDIKKDSIQSIEITADKMASLIGGKINLNATLKNTFGDSFKGEVDWVSSAPAVATIANGVITTVSKGQTKVTAVQEGVTSNKILITVVNSVNDVANVVISSASNTLDAGNTLQLNVATQNIEGNKVNANSYTWTSSNTAVATVSQTGLVTGVANGEVTVTVVADGIKSQEFKLTIGTGATNNSRKGVFAGKNGYTASGEASLEVAGGNGIKLTLADNFSTSNGPGLYLYLSNKSNSTTGGAELGKLRKTSGSDSYTLDGVALDQYKYVLIFCKPFNIPFGAAELK